MRRLAVLASLALVVLAVMASLVLMQGINRQIEDITETYEVRNQARELTLALTDAESSQLGYVLTGEAGYLEVFSRASAAIGTRMGTLQSITRGDSEQAATVDAIVSDIAARVASMRQSMDMMTAGRAEDARALISRETSGRPMDPVRLALEQFISQENQKLLRRNWGIDSARRWLVGSIVVALAGAVALSYMLLTRTQRDVRTLARNSNVLQSENEALEAHVRERTQAVEEARAHAEQERQRVEALLQDTSHRIGNSLATVSSLLGLQLLRSKSEEVREALEAARSRVHAIASAHRRLRLGDDLETASADEFLEAVLQDLETSVAEGKTIELIGEIEPIVISARDATTVGILVAELVTNALKHAFPGDKEGQITVSLKRDSAGVPTLGVIDNGAGMDPDSQPGEGGLGSVIVKQLSHQFGGAPSYERPAAGGLSVTVPLPTLERSTVVS